MTVYLPGGSSAWARHGGRRIGAAKKRIQLHSGQTFEGNLLLRRCQSQHDDESILIESESGFGPGRAGSPVGAGKLLHALPCAADRYASHDVACRVGGEGILAGIVKGDGRAEVAPLMKHRRPIAQTEKIAERPCPPTAIPYR